MSTVNKTQHIIYDENKNEILNYFETSADQVKATDGNTLQTKVGDIQGITDSLASTSSNIALSAQAGKTLSDNITTVNNNLQLIKSNTSSIIIPTSQYQTNINTVASYTWLTTPPEPGIYSGIVSYGVGFGYEVGKISSNAGYIRFVNPNANAVPTERLWSVINNVLQNSY